jgi:preprotein translocase subunit YajC
MFVSPAFAQALGGGSQDTLTTFILPMGLIFVVFYFFMIRPQQTKAKQLKIMLDGLRRGDRVVTGGGIIGTISKVESETEVSMEIAENVRVRVLRGSITAVLTKPEPVAAKKPAKEAPESEKKTAEPQGAGAGSAGSGLDWLKGLLRR